MNTLKKLLNKPVDIFQINRDTKYTEYTDEQLMMVIGIPQNIINKFRYSNLTFGNFIDTHYGKDKIKSYNDNKYREKGILFYDFLSYGKDNIDNYLKELISKPNLSIYDYIVSIHTLETTDKYLDARRTDPLKTFYGGGKTKMISKKEILGKERCIYKIQGDRKEYLRYKGDLITVKDYKKVMSNK